MKNFLRKGQALVEAIVALSVLLVGFLSLISLLNNSLGLSRVVVENYIATYLAAEGIEYVKNVIDNNTLNNNPWNQSLANDGYYELIYNNGVFQLNGIQSTSSLSNLKFDSNSNSYNNNSGQDTPFKRYIQIQNKSANEIVVNSVVFWTSRGGGKLEVNLEDHFFNIGGFAGGSTSTIDTLAFFKKQNFILYPTTTVNVLYSTTSLSDCPNLQGGCLQFNQFMSFNSTNNTGEIYLEKWRDPSQVIKYTYDSNYIYLKEDSTAQYPYSFTNGKWLKRFMNIGEQINVTNNLEIGYSTSTCNVFITRGWPYTITLENYYPSYDAGGNLGNVEVIVVKYDWTQASGTNIPHIEREYYAKGYGIFKWEEEINGQITRSTTTPYIIDNTINPPPLPKGRCFNYF